MRVRTEIAYWTAREDMYKVKQLEHKYEYDYQYEEHLIISLVEMLRSFGIGGFIIGYEHDIRNLL